MHGVYSSPSMLRNRHGYAEIETTKYIATQDRQPSDVMAPGPKFGYWGRSKRDPADSYMKPLRSCVGVNPPNTKVSYVSPPVMTPEDVHTYHRSVSPERSRGRSRSRPKSRSRRQVTYMEHTTSSFGRQRSMSPSVSPRRRSRSRPRSPDAARPLETDDQLEEERLMAEDAHEAFHKIRHIREAFTERTEDLESKLGMERERREKAEKALSVERQSRRLLVQEVHDERKMREDFEKSLDDAAQSLGRARDRIRGGNTKISSLHEENEDLRKSLDAVERELRHANEKWRRTEKQLSATTAENNDLRNELSSERDTRVHLQTLLEECNEARKKAEDARAMADTARQASDEAAAAARRSAEASMQACLEERALREEVEDAKASISQRLTDAVRRIEALEGDARSDRSAGSSDSTSRRRTRKLRDAARGDANPDSAVARIRSRSKSRSKSTSPGARPAGDVISS